MSGSDTSENSYGFIDMARDSLTVPIRPYAVFDSLSPLPPPSYLVMAANLSLFSALALLINITHAYSDNPLFFGLYGQTRMIVGGTLLWIVVVVASLPAAAALHGLTRLCGGTGRFQRSYQILSMVSSLSVLKALLDWFPSMAFASFLLAIITVVVGVQCLHAGAKTATWAVFGFLGLSLLAGQWLLRQALERHSFAALPAGPATLKDLSALEDRPSAVSSSLQSLRPGELPLGPDPFAEPTDEDSVIVGANPSSRPIPPIGSAPDLSRFAGLAQANRLLNDPGLLRSMPPAQAAKMKEFIDLYNQMQKNMAAGKPMSKMERDALAKKSQQLMMEMMSSMQQIALPPKNGGLPEGKNP